MSVGQGKEYAEALFALAMEEGQMEAYLSALKEVNGIFNENPEYLDLLATPSIPGKERSALLTEVFQGSVPENILSFLCVLTEHGQINSFDECLSHYASLCNAAFGVSIADVTSAAPLTDDEKERLQAKLEWMSGHRVEIRYRTDASLLGGMVIHMDDTVMDGSLKHRLSEIMKGSATPSME